jgi:hypothetical protein
MYRRPCAVCSGARRSHHRHTAARRRAPTGRTELETLDVDGDQLDALEAFLRALDSEG